MNPQRSLCWAVLCTGLWTPDSVYGQSVGVESREISRVLSHAGDEFAAGDVVSRECTVVGATSDDDWDLHRGVARLPKSDGSNRVRAERLRAPSNTRRFGNNVDGGGNEIAAGRLDGDGEQDECDCVCEWSPPSLQQESPMDSENFGWSIAADDNALIVGAARHGYLFSGQGSAYAFRRRNGEWVQEDRLWHPDADQMGWSVDVDDNAAIVGADGDTAYIYRRQPGGMGQWQLEAELGPYDGLRHFGNAVAIQGNLAVAGSPEGSVYIYRYDGHLSDWFLESAFEGYPGGFGGSLAIRGQQVLVGAADDQTFGDEAGAVYILENSGASWMQVDVLHPSEPWPDEFHFGSMIAVEGDLAVVSAVGGGSASTGSTYVYRFDDVGHQWIEEAILEPFDDLGLEEFGHAVATDGNLVAVGTDNELRSVYVFRQTEGQWHTLAKLTNPNAEETDFFGAAAALDDDTLWVGAWNRNGGILGSGMVFAYPGISADCNDNGFVDVCDISSGGSEDDNLNDVPDECEPPPIALTRVASVLVHDEGGPNESPRFHDLIAANGVEPRRGGPKSIYFESPDALDPATANADSVSVTCVNGSPPAHDVYLQNANVFVVEFDEPLPAGDCCTIAYPHLRTEEGLWFIGPIHVRSLEGDMNFDGVVSGSDALLIKPFLGDEVDPFFPHWDYDRSGNVSGADYALIKPLFGHTAPACP